MSPHSGSHSLYLLVVANLQKHRDLRNVLPKHCHGAAKTDLCVKYSALA